MKNNMNDVVIKTTLDRIMPMHSCIIDGKSYLAHTTELTLESEDGSVINREIAISFVDMDYSDNAEMGVFTVFTKASLGEINAIDPVKRKIQHIIVICLFEYADLFLSLYTKYLMTDINGTAFIIKKFRGGKLHCADGPAVVCYSDNNVIAEELYFDNGKPVYVH